MSASPRNTYLKVNRPRARSPTERVRPRPSIRPPNPGEGRGNSRIPWDHGSPKSSDIEALAAFGNAYLKVLTYAPRSAPSSSWPQTPAQVLRPRSMSPTPMRGSGRHARATNEEGIAHRLALAIRAASPLVEGPIPSGDPVARSELQADLGTAALPQELGIPLALPGTRVHVGARRRRGGGPPARSMHSRPRPDCPPPHPR